jgi:hypothetical protein
MELPV